MDVPKRYNPRTIEPDLLAKWEKRGVYHYQPGSAQPVYSIDTPPATVSGHLHLGHVYSYTHADLFARFWRMRGYNVFYPMGFDDNGLPTDRLLEKTLGEKAHKLSRTQYIQKCLELSEEFESEYRHLWTRIGLSIDWRFTYRTIDSDSRKTTQSSFLELYTKGDAYLQKAPSQWCSECSTGIAQAEVDDIELESQFLTLSFTLEDGTPLHISTTRPELLPACVAIFVHPHDSRAGTLKGKQAKVPIFNQKVPILIDPSVDPQKGTGIVMCCTFGDTADVDWWKTHNLPLVSVIDQNGTMTTAAGKYADLKISTAREAIINDLESSGYIQECQDISHTVRVHERCDTPIEYIITSQWFIKALDYKEDLLKIGKSLTWHPSHMQSRYQSWVENLAWDWCISRQRSFGIPIPVWYCNDCGCTILPKEELLPVDPMEDKPPHPCSNCGSTAYIPEQDVMDTWATSSHTPQLCSHWLKEKTIFNKVYPMSLRPQAHEIIRTWAFYTILKAYLHELEPPWKELAISGWGIAAAGQGKISKSRGGGPIPPLEAIDKYSADAVRYWASSTGLGKDSIIDEEKIHSGTKLITKLWNVSRFSARFLEEYHPPNEIPELTPADHWMLARVQHLIRLVTNLLLSYEYAAAKSEVENLFWKDLADNYIEMVKQRLYNPKHPFRPGARYTLYTSLLAILKMFAPFIPFVTERIYLLLFKESEQEESIHTSAWPQVTKELDNARAIKVGQVLVEIATLVRRYKSENNLSLGTELTQLQIACLPAELNNSLQSALDDLHSITRARKIEISETLPGVTPTYEVDRYFQIHIKA
jgi:valyl-tRNA synthetase